MGNILKIVLRFGGVILALFAVLIGVTVYQNSSLKERIDNSKKVNESKMTKFEYSVGGGMRGESSTVTVSVADENSCLITETDKEYYAARKVVHEYRTEADLLGEIEDIFRENKMQKWSEKDLRGNFVADGASESYRFSFTDTDVYFSSQYYPKKYSEKLAKIDEVIESRKKAAEQLPALKLPVGESEDQVSPSADIYPTDGYLGLYLESYEQNELHYVIRNGRKEAFPGIDENGLNANVSEVKIIDLRSQEELPLLSPRYGYGGACAGENIGEGYVTPESWLEPGHYELRVENLACEFEIVK
ncbi:MAG: hypothetical protein LKE64_00225 [Solobacterium sp.]|jgi:hypothetical protein|nr:hypothetical protein [Solobacterium sp.]MCH4050131.1 hypothetical protein [Solobacterium sp.]MCH4073817.1 hypothetical protein [Solobacterium sp.]